MKEINFMNSLYKYLCELIELQQYIFFTFFFVFILAVLVLG